MTRIAPHTPPREAKKMLARFLAERGITYTRLTARTIDFTDLMRDYAVFVTVHGWKPSHAAADAKAFGKEHGFIVDFSQGD